MPSMHAAQRLKIKPTLILALTLGLSSGALAASSCKSMNENSGVVLRLGLLGGQELLFSGDQFNPQDQVNVAWQLRPGPTLEVPMTLSWGNGAPPQPIVARPHESPQNVGHIVRDEQLRIEVRSGSVQMGPVIDFTLTCTPAPVQFTIAEPAHGAPGDDVIITGSGFWGVSHVLFGETRVTPTIHDSTRMDVTVPAGMGSVPLKLVNEDSEETATGFSFSYLGAPSLEFTSSPPVEARVGSGTYSVTTSGDASGQVLLNVQPSSANVCALDGNQVSFIGAGTCAIAANLPAQDSQPALQAMQEFQIEKASTSIALTRADEGTVSPSSALEFTAQLSSSNAAAGGAVAFMLGSQAVTNCEAVPVTNGIAQCSTSLQEGDHQITAVYSGDANSEASASQVLSVTVAAASTPTTPHAVPTLSPWSLSLLSGSLLAALGLRRRLRRTS